MDASSEPKGSLGDGRPELPAPSGMPGFSLARVGLCSRSGCREALCAWPLAGSAGAEALERACSVPFEAFGSPLLTWSLPLCRESDPSRGCPRLRVEPPDPDPGPTGRGDWDPEAFFEAALAPFGGAWVEIGPFAPAGDPGFSPAPRDPADSAGDLARLSARLERRALMEGCPAGTGGSESGRI